MDQVIRLLGEMDDELGKEAGKAFGLIGTYLGDVLADPGKQVYRTIRKDNPVIIKRFKQCLWKGLKVLVI